MHPWWGMSEAGSHGGRVCPSCGAPRRRQELWSEDPGEGVCPYLAVDCPRYLNEALTPPRGTPLTSGQERIKLLLIGLPVCAGLVAVASEWPWLDNLILGDAGPIPFVVISTGLSLAIRSGPVSWIGQWLNRRLQDG